MSTIRMLNRALNFLVPLFVIGFYEPKDFLWWICFVYVLISGIVSELILSHEVYERYKGVQIHEN